jgi:hypothetical protein
LFTVDRIWQNIKGASGFALGVDREGCLPEPRKEYKSCFGKLAEELSSLFTDVYSVLLIVSGVVFGQHFLGRAIFGYFFSYLCDVVGQMKPVNEVRLVSEPGGKTRSLPSLSKDRL